MTMDDRHGTLAVEGERATITFQRRLRYPIEAVWAAITDPAQRAAWFGQTTVEPRAGGEITMMPDEPPVAPEVKRMTGRILAWEPPGPAGQGGEHRTALLEHEWRQRVVEDGVVRYQLAEDGDHTVLTFTHVGLSVRNAQGFIAGQHAFLDRLEAHLAGTELPRWADRYSELVPAYA